MNNRGHAPFRGFPSLFWLGLLAGFIVNAAGAEKEAGPLRLHPENSHYFLWRGQPTVLITSGEHYGAVLNRKFNYKKYFQALQSYGFNLTRTFSGAYCEPPGAFNIQDNTLAPQKRELLCPWARGDRRGYAGGGNKFDLNRWDPAYFKRLHDFLQEAGRRGVVVEFVLFCPFYKDSMWRLSPMNATNNINDIGKLKREEVYTLKDKKLQAVQDAMVRKIVKELKDYDNLYYEICNEPYFGGVTLTWQAHIAGVIVETEKEFKHKHLIAQNIANKGKKIEKPNPHVSIFNFHYAKPPFTVYDNFHLNRPLGDDETGFAGSRPEAYRREGWDFMLAGGAVFDNLDYSFNVGHEDGTAQVKAPGSVGREMHRQLKVLKQFMESLDFIHMRPDNAIIKSKLPSKTTARALVNPNREIAVYINGPGVKELILEIPKGTYRAKWLDPVMGRTVKQQSLKHSGGSAQLGVPSYGIDLALHLVSDAVSRKDSISR